MYQKVLSLRIREICRSGRLGKTTHHQNAPFWALCQNTHTPSAPNDIVIETITTAETFSHRLEARGEMRGCDAMELEL